MELRYYIQLFFYGGPQVCTVCYVCDMLTSLLVCTGCYMCVTSLLVVQVVKFVRYADLSVGCTVR